MRWGAANPALMRSQTKPRRLARNGAPSRTSWLSAQKRSSGRNVRRTRATPLRTRGSRPLAADADQALVVLIAATLAVTVRDGIDDLAATRLVAFMKVAWLRLRSVVASAAMRERGPTRVPGARSGLYLACMRSCWEAISSRSATGFPIVFSIEALAAFTSFMLVSLITVAALRFRGISWCVHPRGQPAPRTSLRHRPLRARHQFGAARATATCRSRPCDDTRADLGTANGSPRGPRLAKPGNGDAGRRDSLGRAECAGQQAWT